MLDNWYETMELANMKYETILNDVRNMRNDMIKDGVRTHHSTLSIYVLGGLGKAFSSIGDSLQSHYHFDDIDDSHKHMKKVS